MDPHCEHPDFYLTSVVTGPMKTLGRQSRVVFHQISILSQDNIPDLSGIVFAHQRDLSWTFTVKLHQENANRHQWWCTLCEVMALCHQTRPVKVSTAYFSNIFPIALITLLKCRNKSLAFQYHHFIMILWEILHHWLTWHRSNYTIAAICGSSLC